MGFLDSKTRFLDTIITLEGRKQIAAGKLKAEFFSFSDMGAFYVQDTSMSGAIDGTKRVYLEACSLPQDMISFEADDSGKLVSFKSSTSIVRNGKILTQVSSSSSGSGKVYMPVQDNVFASMTDEFLSSSIDAYTNCYIIGSPDLFDENRDQFILDTRAIDFIVSDTLPIQKGERKTSSVEDTDGVFIDSRLSHLPNFQYLPPINKFRPGDTTANLLGNYPNLNQKPQLTFRDVEAEVRWAVERGYEKHIGFTETSKTNNLVCQLFEIGNNEIVKLDVIDFGIFTLAAEDISLSERQRQGKDPRNGSILTKHVFFAGKVFTDSMGVHKFINLFTLILEG